jgi:ABC-2 type transport system permease protein
VTTWSAVKLVAAREIRVKLRDKAFILSTVFFVVFAVLGTVLPGLVAGSDSVATADRALADTLRQSPAGLDVRVVADDAAAERLVRDGDVDAAVVAGPKVLAMDDAPSDVVRALSTAPPVQLLDPEAIDPFLNVMVPFALAMIFFFTTFLFGLQISQSVVEEKQTRIVEILVAAVPVRALLVGKALAMTTLAFGQILIIAAVAYGGAVLGGGDELLLGLLGPAIGWFLPFYLLGFVMLATLWAAVGATVNRQEDLGSATTPVQMAVMLPFFATLTLSQNPAALTVLSYVPFSAPIAMPIRMFRGDAATWEAALSLGLLAVAAAGLLAVGARIYEGSLLRTNGKTSFATAWRSRQRRETVAD